ncbi:polyketide antibiotic transporter [Nocardioides sp.]|uniref:ABC transporter permease n=1 Tax=Nocardioides sp. TaxID=35761 RepID=UPI001A28DD73|nr:polyketide antibiotic transporter [Nocardioides sp.]MBJ7359272.1 polyketide antibiotic transporter [Nocardioides sp.]
MESNAGFIAMTGPARALNTVGGQVTWQSAAFGAIAAGLMSMFLVGRHTRAEEESGRDEMLRAAAVGRQSTTAAAFLTALVANTVLGAAVALSLIAYPLELADSLALGVGVALCGFFFSGVALLSAQLTSTTRAMYGLTGAVIGLAYALRAIGDVGSPVLSWMSPIGWYQAMHPFSGLRWWPALLLVAASVVAAGAAYVVFLRRDYGSGVFAARPGPPRAARGLSRPAGLAWRLQRGTVLGWGIGMFLGGVGYGTLGDDVDSLLGDSDLAKDMFVQSGGALVDAFYSTMILTLALIGAGFAISSALRPHGEEDAGRVEALLSTALRRRDWLLGHVLVTVAGTVLVLLVAGLGMGVGYALVTGDGEAVADYVLPTLGHLPAVLVLAAVARLMFGVVPRAAFLSWLGLVFCLVVMLFAEVFRMPQWLQDVSPFEHLALMPAEDFAWAPFVAVTAVAVALSVAGQIAFHRRDVG